LAVKQPTMAKQAAWTGTPHGRPGIPSTPRLERERRQLPMAKPNSFVASIAEMATW